MKIESQGRFHFRLEKMFTGFFFFSFFVSGLHRKALFRKTKQNETPEKHRKCTEEENELIQNNFIYKAFLNIMHILNKLWSICVTLLSTVGVTYLHYTL